MYANLNKQSVSALEVLLEPTEVRKLQSTGPVTQNSSLTKIRIRDARDGTTATDTV